MLLSRVADNLYWGARYLERAENTSRIVRSYTDVIVDLPRSVTSSWEPLLAVAGSGDKFREMYGAGDERSIVHFLTAELANAGSVASSIEHARDCLRTCREVFPRDAWQAANDLYLYAAAHRDEGVARRGRARFLSRIVSESRHLDGIITSSMSRDEAYQFVRLGQMLERAEMTTRVLGVRASALLEAAASGTISGRRAALNDHSEVQWMGVLRSLSALQMYQRATRSAIDANAVVRFLLHDTAFPRSAQYCVERVRSGLAKLPGSSETQAAADAALGVVQRVDPDASDGFSLDAEMDRLQIALAGLHNAISQTYFHPTAG
jgi:uncharacterized alpha-E superfamily protein